MDDGLDIVLNIVGIVIVVLYILEYRWSKREIIILKEEIEMLERALEYRDRLIDALQSKVRDNNE